MFKKTLISLAVASSLGLTGCFDSGGKGGNANPEYQITDTTIDRSLVRPIFDPNPLSPTFSVPTHFDLLLLLGATQSANHDFTAPASGPEPVASALDSLSGFSTTSAFNVRFDGELDPTTVAAGQTVFLIALNTEATVEAAPLALPSISPDTITGPAESTHQPKIRAEVVDVDKGVNNAIRITPLEPLEEGRKYLVLVTRSIKGENGKHIDQSVAGRNLAEGPLGNAALQNVKSIVSGLNELGEGVLESSDQDVALAYTFTTNADAEVLRTMFVPSVSGAKLGQQVGFTAQLKAVRDVYTDLNFSELTEKLGELGEKAALVGAGKLDISTLPQEEQAVIARLGELGSITTEANIENAINAEVADGTIHLPQPRPTYFFDAEPASGLATITSLEATNPIAQVAQQVQVSQGAITLPYYQSLPGDDGDGLVNGSWTGNIELEEDLNERLDADGGVFQFLRDNDGETLNVNGNFPFAEQQGTVTVPIVVFHPVLDGTAAEPTACGGTSSPQGVTIFQHGITVDRSAAMLPAILLAQSTCQAVIAIDQPLHGLGGATLGTVPGLAPLDEEQLTTEVNATISAVEGSSPALAGLLTQMVNADYIGERHFNYTRDMDAEGVAATEASAITEVSSGSLFINPGNMLTSRDNLRQSVLDLLNLAATVQTMDVNKDFAPAGDYFGLPVSFVGHSLGGIAGTTFAALVNDPTLNATINGIWDQNPALNPLTYPTMRSVVLHNTGGQVTRLLENSGSRSGDLLDGLADKGIEQKTSNFENFFYIFQSVVDGTDAVNFAMSLGNTTDNLLVTEVIGDSTVPNEANENPLGDAYPAPLAGTEPLMALLDIGLGGVDLADGSEGLFLVDTDNSESKPMPAAVFFAGTNGCTEANHGTFVAPVAPNPNCPDGEADTSTAFTAMVVQTSGAISGAGIAGSDNTDPVPNAGGLTYGQLIASTLGVSETVENALDQDEAE